MKPCFPKLKSKLFSDVISADCRLIRHINLRFIHQQGAGILSNRRRSQIKCAIQILPAVLLTVMTAAVATSAEAQSAPAVYTPAKGSPDRKAILDAVRPLAERDLGAPVEFVVGEFNVAGDMAFVALKAQRPGGGPIDPYRTPFAEENGEEAVSMFDCCHVEAVLQKNQGVWRVLESGVGATDVWYTEWCRRTPPRLIGICSSLTE